MGPNASPRTGLISHGQKKRSIAHMTDLRWPFWSCPTLASLSEDTKGYDGPAMSTYRDTAGRGLVVMYLVSCTVGIAGEDERLQSRGHSKTEGAWPSPQWHPALHKSRRNPSIPWPSSLKFQQGRGGGRGRENKGTYPGVGGRGRYVPWDPERYVPATKYPGTDSPGKTQVSKYRCP